MPAERLELRGARLDFVDWLSAHGVGGIDADDWALVFAELTANAVESAPAGTEVSIRATCRNDRVTLRVTNVSSGVQVPRVPSSVDPLGLSGRGLTIVSTLVDGLVFANDDHETCATCWKSASACAVGAG